MWTFIVLLTTGMLLVVTGVKPAVVDLVIPTTGHNIPLTLVHYFCSPIRSNAPLWVIGSVTIVSRGIDLSMWKKLVKTEFNGTRCEDVVHVQNVAHYSFQRGMALFDAVETAVLFNSASWRTNLDRRVLVVLCSLCVPSNGSASQYIFRLLEPLTLGIDGISGATILDASGTRVLSSGFEIFSSPKVSGELEISPLLAGAGDRDQRLLRRRDTTFVAPQAMAFRTRLLNQVQLSRSLFLSEPMDVARILAGPSENPALPLWRWMGQLYASTNIRVFASTASVQCAHQIDPMTVNLPDAIVNTFMEEPTPLAIDSRDGSLFRELAFGHSEYVVVWGFWCCRCCGFSTEIMHYLVPLERLGVRIRTTGILECFCGGFPDYVQHSLLRLGVNAPKLEHDLVSAGQFFNHTVPKDFNTTLGNLIWIGHGGCDYTLESMFPGRRPDYLVGRVMYEFTRIPENWVKSCSSRYFDELWTPTEFTKQVFVKSGVPGEKIFVIPESLDTNFYDPALYERQMFPQALDGYVAVYDSHDWAPEGERDIMGARNYRFFTSFKWEDRKGWKFLVEAYFTVFNARHPVSLYIHTHIWYNSEEARNKTEERNPNVIASRILDYAQSLKIDPNVRELPHFVVICDDLTEEAVARLYKSMDAFVLPTRGEGWGIPTIQAMAMELPTISTNWGGNAAFMTSTTSYLLSIEGTEEIPKNSVYGYEPGKEWATPSLSHLISLMSHLVNNQAEGTRVGKLARQHVVKHFGEEPIALQIKRRLDIINSKINIRQLTTFNRNDDEMEVAAVALLIAGLFIFIFFSIANHLIPKDRIPGRKED